jgi:hypothetical protein
MFFIISTTRSIFTIISTVRNNFTLINTLTIKRICSVIGIFAIRNIFAMVTVVRINRPVFKYEYVYVTHKYLNLDIL